MKKILACLAVALAVVLGVHGCHGTDPSANPLKPCPAGQVRRVENISPPFRYACFTATRPVTTHRKKWQ